MEELEDKKPNIKLENSAEWLDDPANKIWTQGKFFKESADLCMLVIKGYLLLYSDLIILSNPLLNTNFISGAGCFCE